MLQSFLLSCIKIGKYLETHGFKYNSYNPCVANKIIEGEPLSVVLHVDGVKSSHKGKKLVYDRIQDSLRNKISV